MPGPFGGALSIRSFGELSAVLAVQGRAGRGRLALVIALLALIALFAGADGARGVDNVGDGRHDRDAGGQARYSSPDCEALLARSGVVSAAQCYVDSAGNAASALERSEWLKRSGILFEEAELFRRALAAYQLGGEYAFREGIYPQALYMYERGAELQEEVFGDWEIAGQLYRGAALAAEAKGDLMLSLGLHSGSGERFTQAGSFGEAAKSYRAAAELARQTGRLDYYDSLSRRAAELVARLDAR